MRVRGLKLAVVEGMTQADAVAPHAGAWIETLMTYSRVGLQSRTPCGCVD